MPTKHTTVRFRDEDKHAIMRIRARYHYPDDITAVRAAIFFLDDPIAFDAVNGSRLKKKVEKSRNGA
jgi:hypothetical protein